jgi:hypothetical protein
MTKERTFITIKTEDLPTGGIKREWHKPRGEQGYERWGCASRIVDRYTGEMATWQDDSEGYEEWRERTERVVSLTETDILKYASLAAEELERAENALERAQERHEALKMFVQRLYPVPSLSVVSQ